MQQYVKYDAVTKKVTDYAPKTLGSVSNYNSTANHAQLVADGWELNHLQSGKDGWYLWGYAPQETLHEKALPLSMPKETFVNMVEVLTTAYASGDPTGQAQAITWTTIKAWMEASPDIEKLFIVATEVKRNDPKLDEVVQDWAPDFVFFLDIMFAYQNEILQEIDLAKEQGRPIDLTPLLNGVSVIDDTPPPYVEPEHIPTKEVSLAYDVAEQLNVDGNIKFVLPMPLAEGESKIRASMHIEKETAIDWGTAVFYGGRVPTVKVGSYYNVLWEYNTMRKAWLCGVVEG